MEPSPRVALIGAALLVIAMTAAVVLSRWTPPPRAFLTRQDVPSCPEVELGPVGGELPPAAVACLSQAEERGRGAELRVTRRTEEGDPIRSYYRVLPGRAGLEVFTDHSRDSYGSHGWEHLSCPDARSPEDLGTCSEN